MNCQVCGSAIVRRVGENTGDWRRRKTCSSECAKISRRNKSQAIADQKHGIMRNRTCPACGAPLVQRCDEVYARFAERKTCGGACAKVLMIRTKRTTGVYAPRIVLRCRQCGVEFTERPSHVTSYYGSKRQFCSKACMDEAQRGSTMPLDQRKISRFACAECGAEGWQWPSVERKYCSTQCANVANNRNRNRTRTTGIERAVYRALDEAGIAYRPQHAIDWMMVDAFIPSLNLVIECQGDYWHCNPRKYPDGPRTEQQRAVVGRDKGRRKHLENLGYRLVELWESDIDLHGADVLVQQVLQR